MEHWKATQLKFLSSNPNEYVCWAPSSWAYLGLLFLFSGLFPSAVAGRLDAFTARQNEEAECTTHAYSVTGFRNRINSGPLWDSPQLHNSSKTHKTATMAASLYLWPASTLYPCPGRPATLQAFRLRWCLALRTLGPLTALRTFGSGAGCPFTRTTWLRRRHDAHRNTQLTGGIQLKVHGLTWPCRLLPRPHPSCESAAISRHWCAPSPP